MEGRGSVIGTDCPTQRTEAVARGPRNMPQTSLRSLTPDQDWRAAHSFAPILSPPRSRSPTAEEEARAIAEWEGQAIFRLSSFIDMILEGTFNLVAVNARKFRNDLKIVCRRNDPLYEVIQSCFRRHCARDDIDKATFFKRARTVAQRTEFNVDGLLLTATDVYNEGQRQKASSMNIGKKRSHEAAGYANPLYASIRMPSAGGTAARAQNPSLFSRHRRPHDSAMTMFESELPVVKQAATQFF